MTIVNDIKSLRIQGATAIARESLIYLRKIAIRNGFGKEFWKTSNQLEFARPTAVVLHNCIEILKNEKSIEAIDILLYKLDNDEKLIAKNGENLIKSGFQVHTHCHSSEAIGLIAAASTKRKFHVIVDETRPKYQGLKTARELSKMGIKTTLIIDSAAGFFSSGVSGKKDDIIIVGADALRKEGLVNKIGTYQLALSAFENHIPFYVASTTMKIDKRKTFSIEGRNPDEIVKRNRKEKFSVANPAFDITPWKFVTGIVTEKGIMKPKELLK